MGNVENVERVYFLGAGASKAIYPELPLAADLTLQSLLKYDGGYGPYAYKELAPLQIIRRLVDGPLGKMISIEEVLGKAGADRTSIIQCILVRLSLVRRGRHLILRDWLTQVRSKRHAIVTTNYDNVCERNLDRLDRSEFLDYGIPHDLCVKSGDESLWRKCERPQGLLLLKLHGSVGWSRCLNPACGKYKLHPLHAFAAIEATSELYPHWAACPDCKGDPWFVLVPPIKNKQYDDKALQHIWNRAERVLRTAREIVFAGYSLPESDNMVREMLCRSRDSVNLQKVIVVDKNAAGVAMQFREIYGDLVYEGGSDWRGYLQEMLS
jgi:hypothetical protein